VTPAYGDCVRSLLLIAILSCSISLEVKATYPAKDVTLVTDSLGITHVMADSDSDALYGAGYAQARDRLFQMELVRRQTLGTSAEILGSASAKADLAVRAFDFGGAGVRDEMRLRAENKGDATLLDAWVAGVNARIDEVKRGAVKLPYGFGKDELDFLPAPWTAAQVLAVGKLYAFGLSNSLDGDLSTTVYRLLVPDALKIPLIQPAFDVFTMIVPPQMSRIDPPSPSELVTGGCAALPSKSQRPCLRHGHFFSKESFQKNLLKISLQKKIEAGGFLRAPSPWPARPLGSNNWAVAGSLTDTGKPYVCGDPHQALTSPSRLYPIHLRAKNGALDVIGFSFVGTPAIELGHNARVGWTATTNFADAMDVLDVDVDPDFTHVSLADGDHPISPRNFTIAIKGADPEQRTAYDVPGYGVLIPEEILPLPRGLLSKGGALLLMWTGFSATRELSSYLALDRAQNLDDFERGVDLLDVGAANFIAGDARGTTYKVHARVPDRGAPSSHPMPFRIVSGKDPLALWTHGDLGTDKLPHVRDPARGFVLTANNDPWGFTADGNVENDPFYYGAFYAKGFRAKRIDDALTNLAKSGNKITRADMEALQTDVQSPLAPAILAPLADAVAAIGTDPALDAFKSNADLAPLAQSLATWDQKYAENQGESLAFSALVWFASKRVLENELGPSLFDGFANSAPELLPATLKNALEDRFVSGFLFPNGKRAVLVGALADAAAWLRMRFGSIDTKSFRLGDVQTAHFDEIWPGRLAVPDVVKPGGFDTIDVASVAFFDKGTPRQKYATTLAGLYRMVIGFADDGVPEATFDTARGASGEPDSPHFSDLQDAWSKRTHVALPYRDADIAAHTESSVVLKAAKQ